MTGNAKAQGSYIFRVRASSRLRLADRQKCVTLSVSFPEATTTFGDPLALIEDDKAHAGRFNMIGISARLRLLFVVYAEKTHGETIRIISARRATAHEQWDYEEGKRQGQATAVGAFASGDARSGLLAGPPKPVCRAHRARRIQCECSPRPTSPRDGNRTHNY